MVETYLRQPRGKWQLEVYKGKSAKAKLSVIGIIVPLAEIYEGIEFPGGK